MRYSLGRTCNFNIDLKFLRNKVRSSFDKRLSTRILYTRIFCIVHGTGRPSNLHSRCAAASVWSVGFNFVNQDASRSNELREAKWKEKGILYLIAVPASARKVTKPNGKERRLRVEEENYGTYTRYFILMKTDIYISDLERPCTDHNEIQVCEIDAEIWRNWCGICPHLSIIIIFCLAKKIKMDENFFFNLIFFEWNLERDRAR